MGLGFKSKEQKDQFQKLSTLNKPLAGIIGDMNFFALKTFGKEITITEVTRSNEANKSTYKGKDKTTSHAVFGAVDVRSSNFSDKELEILVAFLKRYDKFNTWGTMSDSKTVLLHAVDGGAMHFHIQYTGPMTKTLFIWDENDERRVDQNSRTA